MTPQQCLEARARLGLSREALAAASGFAAPIVRLYEAGALEGFDDCEAAIAEALYAAEAAQPVPLASVPKMKPNRPLTWLVETGRRWGLSEDAPVVAYGASKLGVFAEIEANLT